MIKGGRNSAMKPASQEKAVAVRNHLVMRNESTFIFELWKHIVRDEREIPASGSHNEADKDHWVAQAWKLDHLDHNIGVLSSASIAPAFEKITIYMRNPMKLLQSAQRRRIAYMLADVFTYTSA